MVIIFFSNRVVDANHSFQVELLTVVVHLLIGCFGINLLVVNLHQLRNDFSVEINSDVFHACVWNVYSIRQESRLTVISSSVIERNCPGLKSSISFHDAESKRFEAIHQVDAVRIRELHRQIITIQTTASSCERHEVPNGITSGIIASGHKRLGFATKGLRIDHTDLFISSSAVGILCNTTSPILELHSGNIGPRSFVKNVLDLISNVDIDIRSRSIRSADSFNDCLGKTSVQCSISIQ